MTTPLWHDAFGELSLDRPADGVRVFQPRRGYRWGGEVYALVAWTLGRDQASPPPPPETAIELGSGSGVIALLLASLGVRVWGVERDANWVALARASAARCDCSVADRVHFVHGDVRGLAKHGHIAGLPARVDVVVANPPWFVPTAGPISPNASRAAARTMLAGNVADFLRAGQQLAPRVCLVTREERLTEMVTAGVVFSRQVPLGGRVALAEWVHETAAPVRGRIG